MKKLLLTFSIALSVFLFAQKQPDFKSMSKEQRKEYIKKLSPEERKKLLGELSVELRKRLILTELNLNDISEENKDAFLKIFDEYLESQKTIKNKFRADFSQENLSDAEAKKMLNQSFDLGQQLLNNRKVYADKFLKILTPQQVLKLFNQEGRMREKFMERRQKMGPPKGREPMPNP